MTDGEERSKRRVTERGAVRSATGLPAQAPAPVKAEASPPAQPATVAPAQPAAAPPAATSQQDRLTRMRLLRAQSSSLVQRSIKSGSTSRW